jgi:vanillate O-demethylase ferredoxin subunit
MHAYEVGTLLSVSEPRNHFPLVTPDGMLSVLVAGGIGITPMLSMAYALHERGEIFQLHYCVRNKARVAFHEELRRTPFADKMRLYVDDMPAAHFSPDSLAVSLSPEAHLYVCGPGPFMDAVLGAARMRGIADSHLHREYFSAPAATASKLSEPTASFIVRVASTGDNISVAPNESVATALARAGFDVPLSCGQGVCGTCRTRVLSGIPDHHDICLDDAERASNAWFTPCCSRSLTPVLEIDL